VTGAVARRRAARGRSASRAPRRARGTQGAAEAPARSRRASEPVVAVPGLEVVAVTGLEVLLIGIADDVRPFVVAPTTKAVIATPGERLTVESPAWER